MNAKNEEGLAERAQQVSAARKRLDLATAVHEDATAELRSAEEAVRQAESVFVGFAWGAFGLPTPFDRHVGKPGDRPSTRIS